MFDTYRWYLEGVIDGRFEQVETDTASIENHSSAAAYALGLQDVQDNNGMRERADVEAIVSRLTAS